MRASSFFSCLFWNVYCKTPLYEEHCLQMQVVDCQAKKLAPTIPNGQYCPRRRSQCRRQSHDCHSFLPKAPRENRRRKARGISKKKIGAGDVVEVDECYTSGGKGGRKVARQGRGLAGKIAFAGAIERHGRRVRIERIESASRENLTSFICRNVRSGSTVHTDSFKSYLDVPKYGYTHCRVNHFLTFKDRKSGACTNMIESVWSQMLCHWERFRGGFRNNLDLWIAEIEFRIENNKNLPSALKRILRKK